MHDGMPYDPIQGQGHETSCIFNGSWQMTTDSETMEQYLNFVRTRFLISVLVFVSRDYELGRVSDFGGVDRQSHTGLIFFILYYFLSDCFWYRLTWVILD